MTFTYTGDPSLSDVAAVRFEISDTDVNAQLFSDDEISWAIKDETGIAAATPAAITGADLYRASARCMETLARRLAAQADIEVGSLRSTYSDQAVNYAKRAAELRARAAGMNAPYAGGLSLSEKTDAARDPDRVKPAFTRDEFDSPWAGRTGVDSVGSGPLRDS